MTKDIWTFILVSPRTTFYLSFIPTQQNTFVAWKAFYINTLHFHFVHNSYLSCRHTFFLILKVLLKCKHTRILCKLPNALLRWIDEIHWWCMSIYVNFSSLNWTIQFNVQKLEYTKLCYHSRRRISFISLSIIEIPYYLVQSCHGRLRSCMMVSSQAPWLHLDF